MSVVVSSEFHAQKRLIKDCLIHDLGYEYIGNLHDLYNKPVDEARLTVYLYNRGYPKVGVVKAVKELKDLSEDRVSSLYDLNKRIYSLLRYGITYREPGQKDKRLHYIDWEHPDLNDFAVAEEVTVRYTTGKKSKRPDIVLYVNGIALGMFELKKSCVEASQGIRQLITNQKPEYISGFFTTQQLLLAGNEAQGLFYGTIETPEKFYLQWREDPKASDETSIEIHRLHDQTKNPLQHGVISLCEKRRLLQIIHDFIIFDAGIKKVPRANQFFANLAARPFIERGEGGIIWNTQGSGKSLIMAWLAKWIIEHIDDSRVVIITDRDELDKQIRDLFFDIGEKIRRATSGADLREILNKSEERVVCSLIHKYGHSAGKDSDIEAYRRELLDSLPSDYQAKGHIVAFIDEAHRTNSGKLHEAVRQLMPGATLIGFTGTPLLKRDKKTTLEIFGPYIHTYKFNEGVADGVVLDLRYEARDVDQELSNETKVDQWFDSRTAGLTETAKDKLKASWSTLNKLYSSKDRLQKIVSDVIFDMQTKPRLKQDRGTAMLVAGSIYQACRYWELFQMSGFKRCAVVTSYEPTDASVRTASTDPDQESEDEYKKRIYERMLDGKSVKDFEDEAKRLFKDEPARMKLLIVVDKLLTGFDAPSATYLYVDKSMRDHDLFQAICRVNRPDDPSKDYGYIVDYKDLFRSVQSAFVDYTSEAFDGFAPEDVEGLIKQRALEAKAKMEGARDSLSQLLSEVPAPRDDAAHIQFFCEPPAAEDETDADSRKRTTFYGLVSALTRSFADCADRLVEDFDYTARDVAQIRADVHNYNQLKDAVMLAAQDWIDLRSYQEDMRFILDTYVTAQDSTLISKLDDTPLVELLLNNTSTTPVDSIVNTVTGDDNAKAEIIDANLTSEIIRKMPINKAYFGKMSELLKRIIDERRLGALSYAEYLRQVTELARRVHNPEETENYPEQIKDTQAGRALYDFVCEQDSLDGVNLGDLAFDLHYEIIESLEDGWLANRQKQQRIKRAIAVTLREYRCPADQIDILVDLVYEMATRQEEYFDD
ncbi:MAG: HsdR family type I site-specific deoxyribonuclease [Cutibacterium granulosum]|uniref:type I restriction endonuclease subunit R n=1 Tax=Cutibacterium granulosum TaxID=33011 RepID=UPI00291583DA|nr:HsdR family type I site-specific deoxyribonuclease [Cutibacterium granulosum]MDU3821999.1 HsdR family type I site-specific deoxyribonuclease [Cutibacterium granulosum]